jgi:hypothetical protein
VLILAFGLLLGAGLGGASGLVLETLDSSLHDSRGLQAATNVPVLASIPLIMLPPDLTARRRRLTLQVLAAAAVVFFSLGGGLATYVVVNNVSIFPTSVDDVESEPVEAEEDQVEFEIQPYRLLAYLLTSERSGHVL